MIKKKKKKEKGKKEHYYCGSESRILNKMI
jgi:hypothetical protein